MVLMDLHADSARVFISCLELQLVVDVVFIAFTDAFLAFVVVA
jgi:hypothetical protein